LGVPTFLARDQLQWFMRDNGWSACDRVVKEAGLMQGEIHMSQLATVAIPDDAPPIDLRNLIWVALALAVLVAAIAIDNLWLLNFIHVMAGVLWTGIDLFMGFVIGPILRRSPFSARRAIVLRLMPKTLFLLPTLSAITGTAGWYHARQLGLLEVPYPAYWWVLAALVILAVLTV